jgi:sulfite oxidase
MRTLVKEVQGIDWGDAAIMNCKWKGPRLRDVILRAGLRVDATNSEGRFHVAFASYQAKCQDEKWFEASVPLEMCLQVERDAILVLEVSLTVPTSNFYLFDML